MRDERVSRMLEALAYRLVRLGDGADSSVDRDGTVPRAIARFGSRTVDSPMFTGSITELADWLNSGGARCPVDARIDAPLAARVGSIAAALSESAADFGALAGAAWFAWTLLEHARGNESLSTFVAEAARSAPEKLRTAAQLFATLGDRPDRSRVRNALTLAATPHAHADGVLDMINLTLAYARRTTRRYASGAYPKYVGALAEFSRLPTLTRADVERDIADICAQGAPIDFYTATSATTTGRTLLVPHCRAEFATLTAGQRADASEDDGMSLRLLPAGRLIGGDMGGDTVLVTYDPNAARESATDMWDHIAGQLFAEFPTPLGGRPIRSIHATPPFGLVLLTKYMLQRGLDPRESAVRSLLVTGAWTGPTTRRWLEHAWDAEVQTTYSCSEMVGAAVACPLYAGRYHFGANLLAEVLDDDGEPVGHEAQGRVHLSGLYPFQRSAMFLRYEIGDWGRWYAAGACGCGLRGASVEMLGRTTDLLSLATSDGTHWRIGPIPIRNALDRFDFVPKIPRPQYKLSLDPKLRVPLLRVDVECYALAGQAWQRRAREAIAAAILEEDRSLRTLAAAGEIEISVALFARSRLTSSVRVR